MSHGLEYDITQAKAMILRGEKDLRKEPGIVTPTPQTEIERKEVEEIQRLEEVIANAERVLEGNQVLEETLLRELAEIRGENVEIQTKSTEELEKELSALRAELEGTLAIRFMKRRGLKERISELDKKIINQIQLEEDRKQNPFKYYLIDKLHPTNFSILFHGNKEGISVKKINKTTGEDGRNLKFWDLKLITTDTDNEKEKRLAAQKRMKERTKREEEAKQAQQPVDTSRPSPFSPLSEKTPPTPKETLHKVKPVPAETPDVKTITPEPSIETKMPAPTLSTEEIKPQEEKDGPPILKRTPDRKAEVLPTTKEETLRRIIEKQMEEADARRTPARKGGEVPGRVTGYNPPQYDEYGRRVGGGPK